MSDGIHLSVVLLVAFWSSGSTLDTSSFVYRSNEVDSDLPAGLLTNRTMRVERGTYVLREDLIVDSTAALILDPGVRIGFAPTVGITVRGSLTAVGSIKERISLTSIDPPEDSKSPQSLLRLVDGSSILSGRLQSFHNGKWRSVCSNSRRWSREDVDVACREMGWRGGAWLGWMDREAGQKSRLLLLPNCTGVETSLSECEKSKRQMGGPACDYHPDIALECFPFHQTYLVQHHWRGIRFENAKFARRLTLANSFYVPVSESRLENVDIRFAGSGREYNASSAIETLGVPPSIASVTVYNSAYNGINITNPLGPVDILNSSISNNRGYGIYVNSSDGGVRIEGGHVADNGGDGIRYVGHEFRLASRNNILDLCTLPTTSTQTFPLIIALQQNMNSANLKECEKYFYTRPGYVLTVNFLSIFTSRNGSSHVAVYDGISSDRGLAHFDVFNSSKPQSVTTTRNNVFIRYSAKAFTDTYILIKITSGPDKWSDLNVTDTIVTSNNGRGIAVENLRSRLNVLRTSVSHNNHVAGIHVMNGAGHVNVTESRIAFNLGDGVNVSYAGGSTNVSRTTLSSNDGNGLAVWFNKTSPPEFIAFNQSTVVQYSEIFRNVERGVFVGNFCSDSIVNVTGNGFNMSLQTAVEVESCWKENSGIVRLFVGYNTFTQNRKTCVKLRPALNLEGHIEYNKFVENTYGGILIKNDPIELFEVLPTKIVIRNNEFYQNSGPYVVNLGLSPFSDVHSILFTWNYVKRNRIFEPFDGDKETRRLTPRSRVAAPIVVSSENTVIFRNIIHNSESLYEIGVHLQDQSQYINCTYNWLGSLDEEKFFYRLFDRKDRYNLARIEYIPFLLHPSHPGATTIMPTRLYVPLFQNSPTTVGGEVEGLESLRPGEYIVERDINIRPEGRLTLEPGVTLRFPPGVGMMVGGKLEARGRRPNDILLTLKEEVVEEESTTILDNENGEPAPPTPSKPAPKVRLIGGSTSFEGTLQVMIGGQWGTVCNYGWTQRDASLVCNQLGLVLNPSDWLLYRSDIPHPGTNDPILMTKVDCTEEDVDITECRSEKAPEFENSCNHLQDVLMRCYPPQWAGVRMGALAETSHFQYITIQQAGILDYATNQFQPALQIDVGRHAIESVRLIDNADDGLGIIYSDIFAPGQANTIKNCEFSNNKGSGVSFRQVGAKIIGSKIENNRISGIRHNPVMSALAQREFAGWFQPLAVIQPRDYRYKTTIIPFDANEEFKIEEGATKYFITQKISMTTIERVYNIRCNPGYVIGIQLLNPIHNRSTEQILIHDAPDLNAKGADWILKRDLNVFPTTSTSFGVVLKYKSGNDALGMVVIAVSTTKAPIQNIPNRIVKGPIPTLTVFNSRIKGNTRGIWASYYNRYLTELGEHYLRKCNESIHVISSDISHNRQEAVFVDAPHWSVSPSNLSEITLVFNSTLITDNGRGFLQFSRDLRNSTNLFHWMLNDNSIERNSYGGFEVSLPYVWQYNENFTHSVSLRNNTWRNNRKFGVVIGGHFAHVNISDSVFEENLCRMGLISIQGMEKHLRIRNNAIEKNTGVFMVEFKADSQSEIMGELLADFRFNTLKRNSPPTPETPSSVILFDGVQKVVVLRNLISENTLGYALVAGVRTARLNQKLIVAENWWGTTNGDEIKRMIFDFDDWNDHAQAVFRPYMIEESFEGSLSASWDETQETNLDVLGGRLMSSLILHPRGRPYRVLSDLTVMPTATLTLYPGVELEFAPRVGILVLGRLVARGSRGNEILMRPIPMKPPERMLPMIEQTVRLCTGLDNCSGTQGFVERWNSTTQQWVPVCDPRFSERNAQVTCRQLNRDSLDIYVGHSRRWELHHSDTSRIWSWHEPLQCTGDEKRLEDCEIRLNGQVYGHIHRCEWDDEFVFVHCGQPVREYNNWGGVRIANSEFEQSDFTNRIHDVVTHSTLTHTESILEFVNITGAGLLHSQKSPAVLAISRSPEINNVNVTGSVDHGISVIGPTDNMRLLFNRNYGVGVNVGSLTGEGRESGESSFTPLKEILIPYRAFSLVDMCDPAKEVVVQERLIVYYVYDNRPINCVKIFRSAFRIKPFGFRLLQFNLFNYTDKLDLYDGGLYNRSLRHITTLSHDSPPGSDRKFVRTLSPWLSVRLVASAASQTFGFVAEIVTLPISAIGFNRDVQHNISYSVISENKGGAVQYSGVGEVNPRLTMEKNQIRDNCIHMYGNFTSCQAAVHLDLQNTQNLHFRNNLVLNNQGGLYIRADSSSSATSLKGWIHNNLFAENKNKPAMAIEGRQSSPYQEVTVYHNYYKGNWARYENTIKLNQVVSNFTYNYVYENYGSHIFEVSGFDRVRLPIYQSTAHNGFYWNYAMDWFYKSTIVAGTAGQHYVDNVFFNPHNDYEIMTVNRSLFDVVQTPIDAKHNYWGYNETLAVMGRIRDRSDLANLLEVDFRPFLMNNSTVLDVKCPPGWNLVGDTCYIYVGAPMTFHEARSFCRSANSTMPYVTTLGNYVDLFRFLKKQQETYQFYDRVWVQHIDRIDQCTVFTFLRVENDNCLRLSPFICEMDPKVVIDALSWRTDVVAIGMIGCVFLALLLIGLLIGFWVSKSRHRHVERLERRNSIRQSLHSVRSFGSSHAFADMYRRGHQPSTQSSPTLNKNSTDYKKMAGSEDSIEKSQFNSSNEEDGTSYDIYEAHNPATTEAINPGFDLSYRNQGFKDTSTFASQDNSTWHSTDDYLNNSSTLPLNTSLALTNSTVDIVNKSDYQREPDYQVFYERPKSSTILETNLDDSLPPARSHSECLLETNFDNYPPQDMRTFQPLSKSQPLETAM